MMPRKKRRLIIALIIISIILILSAIGGTIAYLYINTDSFKSEQQLFEKYIAQNITKMVEIINSNPTEIEKSLNENKFTSELTANVEYTSDVSTSAENKNNTINNAEITVNQMQDNLANYQYKDITLNYNNENNSQKVARFEYIEDNNMQGIRLDYIKQFVSIQKGNTAKLAENTDLNEEDIKKVLQYTSPIEINNILEFTQDEIEILKQTYLGIIEQNTDKQSFGKEQKVITLENNTQITTNGYYITLTKEKYNNIIIKILEKLSTDEIILSKIENISTTLNNYGINIGNKPITRESFSEYLNQTINEIKSTNIGNEQVKVEVLENEGKLVQTIIQADEYETIITIDNAENKITIEKTQTAENKVQKTIYEIKNKTTENSQEISLKYETLDNGVKSQGIDLEFNQAQNDKIITRNASITYDKIQNIAKLNIKENINIVDNFEDQILLDNENNIKIDELDKDSALIIKENLEQNIDNQLQTVYENILPEDINSALKGLGFIKENILQEAPVEVSETERNRFNSNLSFFIGNNLTAENIEDLLEVAKNNIKDANIELTQEEKEEDRKLSQITLEIERDSQNEEVLAEISDIIEENKNEKFNVTMSYDENTQLINRIFIKVENDEES